MGLFGFRKGMQQRRRRRRWQFLPEEKRSKFYEKSYPEDSERAKGKTEGNIYEASLSLEKLFSLSFEADPCGTGLQGATGGSSWPSGLNLSREEPLAPWAKGGKV